MSTTTFGAIPAARAAGIGMRAMEVATALFFLLAGAVAMADSLRLGAGWGQDGPQSGYFPFWLGAVLVLASLAQLGAVARARGTPDASFLSWEQGRTVLTVLAPTAIFILLIPFAGLYAPAAALVAWFMWKLGDFAAPRAVLSGLATALVTFVVFEIWLLVALPKGPIETALGY